MRVVGLIRVSTERQADQGTSLDAQSRMLHELAAKNGWQIIGEFKGCESATLASSDRRVLQQVLEAIRTQSPDAVWVFEQSRLTRGDDLEVAMLLRELRERNLKVIICNVVRDLASIDERLMVSLQGVIDRAESERIKERLGRGKKERARRGEKASGPAPFGYRNPAKGMAGRGKLQIVGEQAATIRRVFELALKGMGNGKIAAELNRLGLPASRGGEWVKTAVARVLMNPAYIGVSAANVWVGNKKSGFRFDSKNPRAVWIEGAHDAIIDRATWEAINGRPKNPTTAVPRMLTGLLWAGGRKYGGDTSGGRAYYRAPRGLTGMPWLDADATDERVWSDFARLATGPEFVASLMESARDRSQESIVRAEIEHLAEQVQRRERRIKHLTEMRLEGDIDPAEYRRRKDEEEQALAGLRADLDIQRARAASLDVSQAPRVARAVQVLLAGRSKLTVAQRRQILNTIVRRVEVAAELAVTKQGRSATTGQVVGGRTREWKITAVTFHLSVGGATGGEYGPHAGNGADLATASAAATPGHRSGQSDTTSCDCAQVADAGGDSTRSAGAGQLDTTCSCSGPPAPAKR